jgi:hypothetical protein
MKSLYDILESLLDDEDEIAGRFEQAVKKPHIILDRDCDDFREVVEALGMCFGVKPKIKKGTITVKRPWPSAYSVKLQDANYVAFDLYIQGWKMTTFKFILCEDKLILQMIFWQRIGTDQRTGKPRYKGYPRILIGVDDDSKYEWGTSLWEWLSKDPRIVDAFKSIGKQ